LAIFSYVQSIKTEDIAALESCESDLKLHPNSIPVRLRYAQLLTGLAHPEHACRVYEEVILLDNKNHEARLKQKNLLNSGFRIYPAVGIFGRIEIFSKTHASSPMRESKRETKAEMKM